VPVDTTSGVASYELYTTCGSMALTVGSGSSVASGSGSLTNCGATADMIAETFNGSGQPVDAFFLSDITLVDSVNTLSSAYTAVGTQQVSFTDVPTEVDAIDTTEEFATAGGPMLTGGGGDATLSGGSGSAALAAVVRNAGVTVGYEYQLAPAGSIADEQELTTWGAEPASVSEDIGSNKLRSWVTRPQLDSVNETVSWAAGSAGNAPDYFVAGVEATRQGSNAASWDWFIATGSDGEGSIAFPTLPTDVYNFNFQDSDETTVDFLAGVQAAGGYDAARDTLLDTLGNTIFAPLLYTSSSATGTLATQFYESDDGRIAPPHRSGPVGPTPVGPLRAKHLALHRHATLRASP
jgi:hypothetical protein